MAALAHEAFPPVTDRGVTPVSASDPDPDLDEVLWQAWKAMDLPEGFRAEIVEGFIEVSPTGRSRHMVVINRLRRVLESHLAGGHYAAYQDGNVRHHRKIWIPDLFVAWEDIDEFLDEDGLGVDAKGVEVVVEAASPGYDNLQRDRTRKRRAYARAGIPLYLLIDDFDGDGAVVLMTAPDPDKAIYTDEHRVPYGTDAVIPDGPAKGLVIGEAVLRA